MITDADVIEGLYLSVGVGHVFDLELIEGAEDIVQFGFEAVGVGGAAILDGFRQVHLDPLEAGRLRLSFCLACPGVVCNQNTG